MRHRFPSAHSKDVDQSSWRRTVNMICGYSSRPIFHTLPSQVTRYSTARHHQWAHPLAFASRKALLCRRLPGIAFLRGWARRGRDDCFKSQPVRLRAGGGAHARGAPLRLRSPITAYYSCPPSTANTSRTPRHPAQPSNSAASARSMPGLRHITRVLL